MKKYKSNDYIFVTTYIRCKEKYLLTREKAERMLDSKTPDDAMKVLYEMNYGEGLDDVSAADFEKLLSLELKKTYEMVMSLAPEQDYFTHFLYPADYHNVKVLLKSEFSGGTSDDILMDVGSVATATLTELVQTRKYFGMREEMAKDIQDAVETFGTTRDPQIIDLILDKACYRDINLEVAKLKNDFITGYIELKIDVANLKSFIRAKEMKKPWDFFSKIYIDGGKIPERLFINNYDETPEQFSDRLEAYDLSTLMQESSQMLKDTGRFTVLEKLCDNLLVEYMKRSKYVAFGIEPLVGYLVGKENEVKAVRIIMAGKLAGISADLIRERMRETYV